MNADLAAVVAACRVPLDVELLDEKTPLELLNALLPTPPNLFRLLRTIDEALVEVLADTQKRHNRTSVTSRGNESNVNESSQMTSRGTHVFGDDSILEPLDDVAKPADGEDMDVVEGVRRVEATNARLLNIKTQ